MRISILIASTCLVVPVAAADPLLEMMWAQSKDGPIYAYEMTYEEGDLLATGKVDPSQPEGERITVYSPAEEDWSEDFAGGLAEMEAETDGDIWCADFGDLVPEDADLNAETADTATYAFTPKPEDDADGTEKKMMKKLDGEIKIAKSDGAVLAFKMSAPKPFKPAIVAKIDTFSMAANCARAPDGRTYVSDFNLDISGSAMMQEFEEQVSRRITALLEPVG